MVNYKQGKIYKIECNVTGLIYIGSTCKKKLSGRMTEHRSNYKKYLNGKKKYLSSFKVMENKDYDIILIEDFPCNSKDQLFARERYYTNEIECVNICKNQGLCLELGWEKYCKEYYKVNASTIKAKSKDYYKENTNRIKARHKDYYNENIETLRLKCKDYVNKNKDKRYEKFTCPCGGKYTHTNTSRHMKTKIHLKYLEEQTEE